ncbi:MAG: hypothetical protein J0L87_07010 [Bacteroidetes bacterium]|nr:hypothetical protein [Bacteroidia bacterium]MBN8696263.1 hypothetical protein [Bacteroidota bacterium]
MIATVEISMYALTDGYAEKVIDFIQRVKKHPAIKVEVNGLSTQLFGEYDHLMDVLKKEMRTDFENGKAVFLLKLAGSELTKDKLPEILK